MSWLRVKSAADYLDSSTKSIQRMIKFGLPYHRLPNGTLMFDQNEIDKWVRESDPQKHIRQVVDSVFEKLNEDESI